MRDLRPGHHPRFAMALCGACVGMVILAALNLARGREAQQRAAQSIARASTPDTPRAVRRLFDGR